MRDVVEFDADKKISSGDDETKRMLREILQEVKGSEEEDNRMPSLKLIQIHDSA